MAKKQESKNKPEAGKIASFAAKYSNKKTGAGYRMAIEAFIRCIFNLQKVDSSGKKIAHDYETYFEKYLEDGKRNRSADIKVFSECLVKESVSKQSARQVLTYAVKVLKAHGCTVNDIDVQDIKRECKGGAATVDRVMTADVICKALRAGDVQMRALVLTLASSGLRIGEALGLTMADVDFSMTPTMINVRHTKNGQGRYTFITQEAREALTDYLKHRDEFIGKAAKYAENLNQTIKGTEAIFPLVDSSVNKKWESMLRKAGIYSRDEKSGRNQYRIHSLRKFFVSQVSLAGSRTLAEHLSGHLGYLDASYRKVSPEFAAREYQKIQSVLTCCIPESVKAGIKIQDEKLHILMEKTNLQEDSVEGLKAINRELRGMMEGLQQQINKIMEMLQAHEVPGTEYIDATLGDIKKKK